MYTGNSQYMVFLERADGVVEIRVSPAHHDVLKKMCRTFSFLTNTCNTSYAELGIIRLHTKSNTSCHVDVVCCWSRGYLIQ